MRKIIEVVELSFPGVPDRKDTKPGQIFVYCDPDDPTQNVARFTDAANYTAGMSVGDKDAYKAVMDLPDYEGALLSDDVVPTADYEKIIAERGELRERVKELEELVARQLVEIQNTEGELAESQSLLNVAADEKEPADVKPADFQIVNQEESEDAYFRRELARRCNRYEALIDYMLQREDCL